MDSGDLTAQITVRRPAPTPTPNPVERTGPEHSGSLQS